jgi:hypothetical protein
VTLRRRYRAGESIEDHCRACHEDRTHAVIVVDAEGQPIRVSCGFCGSQHNYRGGPRLSTPAVRTFTSPATTSTSSMPGIGVPASPPSSTAPGRPVEPMTSTAALAPAPPSSNDSIERLLRRIIREEAGLTPVNPADKWRGGELVLKPGRSGVQEKSWPIDTFFHKIVMVRNRLRTLEQQVNASDLPDDQKLKLQAYVTGCYGSLTSFNVLFADDEDRFSGSGQD